MESEDKSDLMLEVDITKMTATAINYWLQRFVVEVRKVMGNTIVQTAYIKFAVACKEHAEQQAVVILICLMVGNLHLFVNF